MHNPKSDIGKYHRIIFDAENLRGAKNISRIRQTHPDAVIVFSTGCMDIVQPGHPIFTEQMRNVGNTLLKKSKKTPAKSKVIVVFGVGRDSTLRVLKSKDRPINSEMNRAYLVASYKEVDYVVLNNKQIGEGKVDFAEVLKLLKPDIFVLNSDDSALPIKKQLCQKLGIIFKTVDRVVPKFLAPTSSTAIIAKIRQLKD